MKIKEGGVVDIQKVKELALANGFKLKEQASGNMDLNAYVYDFANAIEREVKAQAVPEGFVLIKDDTKTVVAIERMVEQQVEASGMDSRRLERLDGWKIIEASVKAQEPAND